MQIATFTHYQKDMLDFSKAVNYLLENGYLAMINGEITITGKFKREFNPVPLEKLEKIFPDTTKAGTREEVWRKFIADAEIPYKATATNGKQYTIRQYSPGIANKLMQIIKEVGDYNVLVESTKLYYKTNGYKKILSNYIDQKIWKDEYERYLKAKEEGKLQTILAAGSGGNRFED
jgi:hypothetical protein